MSSILTFRWPQAVATRRWLLIIVAALSVAGCGWVGPPVPTQPAAGAPGECPDGFCGTPAQHSGGSLHVPGECPSGFCGGPPTAKP
jgi:predicted small lipoprotein YifL